MLYATSSLDPYWSDMIRARYAGLFFIGTMLAIAQPTYDLVIKGGHVIDPRNNIDRVMDVAVQGGKIARIAASIAASEGKQMVDASGLYVTPGLVDIHAHVFAGGEGLGSAFAGGSFGIPPDGLSFRSGVTTVVDAGSSGWRNFAEFKRRIIDRDTNYPKARVLAMLNIVGHGMGGGTVEQNTSDMDSEATVKLARQYPETIVGIKVAHYTAPNWIPVDKAVNAGKMADIPVMVDFGRSTPERSYQELVLKRLRPGDISTHMYASSIPLFDTEGKLLPYLAEARKRGVHFDLGHGNKSFFWGQAVDAARQGWIPDSISTDIHVRSQLTSMKDMTTSMSKVLVLGVPLADVIRMSTSRPAAQIKRPDLGHLSVGAPADIAVLRLEKGRFGYLDGDDYRVHGNQRLNCELTVSNGAVVWDLNGISGRAWKGRSVKTSAR
jgi:dihydroorotase